MLFQRGLPIRETMKICFLVDKIKEHCKGFHKIEGPKASSDSEEDGFYTYGLDGGTFYGSFFNLHIGKKR
jgi:hypothetical protein